GSGHPARPGIRPAAGFFPACCWSHGSPRQPGRTVPLASLDLGRRRSGHRLAGVELVERKRGVAAGGPGGLPGRVFQWITVAFTDPELDRISILVSRLDVPCLSLGQLLLADIGRANGLTELGMVGRRVRRHPIAWV